MPAAREPLPAMLPATISLGQAAAAPWQVVIGGAGPAGAAAALLFARRGLRVLLVDRGSMPRWKVCGCCLSLKALDELRRLGSLVGSTANDRPLLPDHAVPLERVRLSAGGHSATIPLPGGAVVSREALDHALVAAAIRAGCHWLPDTQIVTAGEEPGANGAESASMIVRQAGTQATVHADLVVIATGLGGQVRTPATADHAVHPSRAPAPRRSIDRGSRIGLGVTLPAGSLDLQPGLLEMTISREGYCGMIRLEDGRIDLAAAIDPRTLRGGTDPGDVVLGLLRASGWDGIAAVAGGPVLRSAAFQATPRLTHAAAVVTSPSGRILRAGDAAAYVEPFTGEGIGWALASGRILAESMLPALEADRSTPATHAAAADDYRHAHLRHFRPLHARCRLMALALRRPAIVAAAIRATRLAPWAAERIAPTLLGGGHPGVQPARA